MRQQIECLAQLNCSSSCVAFFICCCWLYQTHNAQQMNPMAHDTLKLCIGFSPCNFAYYHRYLLWCHHDTQDAIHLFYLSYQLYDVNAWNARIFGIHLAH
eukprot:389746_1